MPGGNILISSHFQGRIIEVAPNGDVALEFYSLLTDEPIVAIVSQAAFLPEQALHLPKCGEL
jgi:hypothetical protein